MRTLTLCLALLALAACGGPANTVGEAAPSDTVWTLISVNDAPVRYPASLRLRADGSVSGTGPCSRFTARQTAPLPWVRFRDLTTSARSCPDADNEAAFFIALESMNFAEIAGTNLLLTSETGRSLFFQSAARPEGQL